MDIVPPGRASRFFAPAIRKQLTVMKFLRFSRSKNKSVTQAPAMEELFEETSATLAERYAMHKSTSSVQVSEMISTGIGLVQGFRLLIGFFAFTLTLMNLVITYFAY